MSSCAFLHLLLPYLMMIISISVSSTIILPREVSHQSPPFQCGFPVRARLFHGLPSFTVVKCTKGERRDLYFSICRLESRTIMSSLALTDNDIILSMCCYLQLAASGTERGHTNLCIGRISIPATAKPRLTRIFCYLKRQTLKRNRSHRLERSFIGGSGYHIYLV